MAKAEPSGITLTEREAAIVKGMLGRGDRQHDIAAWFGVNGGRVADISTGRTFSRVAPIHANLPPPGPYLSGRSGEYARTIIAEVVNDLIDMAQKLEEKLATIR